MHHENQDENPEGELPQAQSPSPPPTVTGQHLTLLRYLAQEGLDIAKAVKTLLREAERAAKREARKSRAERWVEAASEAVQALNTLMEIREEFQSWYDNLPENLQQSPVGEKLEAILNIDLDGALSAAEEAENADVPLGFGRD